MTNRERIISTLKSALKAGEESDHMSVRVSEPFYQEIIEIAQAGDSESVIACMVDIINSQVEAPYEAVAYINHIVQSTEIIEASKFRLGNPPDPRWMNCHSDLTHSLEDDDWNKDGFWLLLPKMRTNKVSGDI